MNTIFIIIGMLYVLCILHILCILCILYNEYKEKEYNEYYRGSRGRSERERRDKDEDHEEDEFSSLSYKNVHKGEPIREGSFNCSLCAKCMDPKIKKSAICSYCRQNCGIGN